DLPLQQGDLPLIVAPKIAELASHLLVGAIDGVECLDSVIQPLSHRSSRALQFLDLVSQDHASSPDRPNAAIAGVICGFSLKAGRPRAGIDARACGFWFV